MNLRLTKSLQEKIEARIVAEMLVSGKPDHVVSVQISTEEVLKALDKVLIAIQYVARAYPDLDAGTVCADAYKDFCQNVAEPIPKETECLK